MAGDVHEVAARGREEILKELGIRRERPWELPYSNIATLDDIFYLFRLVLGRNPHKVEWPGHSRKVGEPLMKIAQRFFNSQEFRRRGLLEKTSMNGVVKAHNGRFFVFGDPSDHILQGPCLSGKYEPHVSDTFNKLLRPGDYVVDIGANLGFFSMLAASIVGETGRVYAIEPNDANVKLLESARAANGFDNVLVMQIGLSDKIETLFLYSLEGDGATGNSSTSTALPESIFQSRTVAGLPLDAVLSGRDKPISLIKIDIEGFEYKALLGGVLLLATDKPHIIFEFTPHAIAGIRGIDFLRWITSFGYNLLNLRNGRSLHAIQTEEEVMADFEAAQRGHLDVLAKPFGSALD